MLQRTGALARLLFLDLIGSIVWFPFWWYTTGLRMAVGWGMDGLAYRNKQYAFNIWIKNFFVPMYSQYDWSSRIISVVMRFVVIVARAIALVFEGLIYLFLVVCWVAIPPLAAIMAIQNIISGAFLRALPLR